MPQNQRLAWLGVLSVILLASLFISPEWAEAHVPILCLSRRLGFFCPACGLTRGFLAMGHGEFKQALDYNILAPALYVAAWTWAARLFQLLLSRRRG